MSAVRHTDDYRDHCRDCVHFAPWPERAERVRELYGTVPMGYATGACMASLTGPLAVSPGDSPACCVSAASGCAHFKRGKRSVYIKEAKR